jgi:hypothetical protein
MSDQHRHSRAKVIRGLEFLGALSKPNLFLPEALVLEGLEGVWTQMNPQDPRLVIDAPAPGVSPTRNKLTNVVCCYFCVSVPAVNNKKAKPPGGKDLPATHYGDLVCVHNPDDMDSRWIYVHTQSTLKVHFSTLLSHMVEAISAANYGEDDAPDFPYPPSFNPYNAAVMANRNKPLLGLNGKTLKVSKERSKASPPAKSPNNPKKSSESEKKSKKLTKNTKKPSLKVGKAAKKWHNIIFRGGKPETEQEGRTLMAFLKVSNVHLADDTDLHGYLFGCSLNIYFTAGSFLINQGATHTDRAKAAYHLLLAIDHLFGSEFVNLLCPDGTFLHVQDAQLRAWANAVHILIQGSRTPLVDNPGLPTLTLAGPTAFTLMRTAPSRSTSTLSQDSTMSDMSLLEGVDMHVVGEDNDEMYVENEGIGGLELEHEDLPAKLVEVPDVPNQLDQPEVVDLGHLLHDVGAGVSASTHVVINSL